MPRCRSRPVLARRALPMVLASIAALAALATAVAPAARATLVRPFSLVELCRAAHSVLRGEVVGEEVVWDAARREVYTLTSVAVSDVLVGRERPGDVVLVRQIGGVLDGVERRVVGTADLALGDEVVVFARTDGAFHYLVGMAQGAFHVARAGDGGDVLARTVPAGVLGSALTPGAPLAPVAPDRLRWGELRALVRRLGAEVSP